MDEPFVPAGRLNKAAGVEGEVAEDEERFRVRPVEVDGALAGAHVPEGSGGHEDAIVDATVKRLGLDPSGLLAGHKKDVVLTKQLAAHPKQVAIFGWFKADGRPIQPLYLGHENTYADYSHGIRMFSRECVLDGTAVDLAWLLQDPELCMGVSDEGALPLVRQPMT